MLQKMPDWLSYESLRAKDRMIATDHLAPHKWVEHAERLTPEQLQREILRQVTDTKLQLISILNSLRFISIAICILIGVVIWRTWGGGT